MATSKDLPSHASSFDDAGDASSLTGYSRWQSYLDSICLQNEISESTTTKSDCMCNKYDMGEYSDNYSTNDKRLPISVGCLSHIVLRGEVPCQKGRHFSCTFARQTQVPIIEHRVPVLPVEACWVEDIYHRLLLQLTFTRLYLLNRLRHIGGSELEKRFAGVMKLGDAGRVLRR